MSERTEATTDDRPYKPVDEVSDERFEDVILPERRPPSSIADIQYLYGQFVLIGQELRVDHSLTPDQQAALTLREASELVGHEQGVVYLDVELDTDAETLTPIETTVSTLTRWHLEKTAFSYYDASRAVDHSITQRTGKSTKPATVAGSQLEKVTRRWADEDSIKPLAESHEDGWIISELQSLHAHDAMDEIVSDLEEQLTGRQYRLLSIRFHTGTPPTEKGSWLYPADMDVLLDGMMARREHKWATKNDCESAGEATGYVQSDQPKQTVYGMGTDPLSLYTGKKRAWMPRLNRDEAAGNHPLSDSVTKKLAAASPLLEACSQPHGLSLYHFPYFDGEQTVEKMRWLYQLLWETFIDRQQHDEATEDADDEPTWNTIENFYAACQAGEIPDNLIQSLSVWSIAIQNYQADRKRALAEIKQASIPRYIDLAATASDVAGDLGTSDTFETYEWDFATPDTEFLPLLTSPRYFFETTVTTTDEDDVDTNQPGYRFYRQLLAGDDISVSELLDAYTEEIDDRYRSNLEDGADFPVPSYRLIQQFAQLCVLGRANALNVDIPLGGTNSGRPDPATAVSSVQPYQIPTATVVGHETATISAMTDDKTDTTPNDPANRAEAEAQAYRTMIEEQPVFTDSPARRAAFTLGALITTVSGHQRGRDVQPLSAKLSPSTISKHSFEEYVTEVIELINRYATADDKQWRYTAQTSQLTEDLTAAPPEEWRLSTSDVQYHIALGMAFGAEQHDTLSEPAEEADDEAEATQN
jgi:hypothetical protein